MSGSLFATIFILWVTLVAGITLWFVDNPVVKREPVDLGQATTWPVRMDQQDGYSLHDGFDRASWTTACGIASALAVVALGIIYVWSRKAAS